MTVQTDKTLKEWSRVATDLGPETSILILAAVAKAANRIGASADTEADAMPHAFLGYRKDGVSIEQAAYQSVLSLHRKAQTKAADPDSVSLDDVETSADRDALEIAVHSSRDDVARSYGGGSRGSLMSLTEALELAPKGAATIVTAVITDGLTRKVADLKVETTTADGATDDDAMALHGGMRKRHGKADTYRPLKVSVVALAAGVARPRTKAASADLRRAGCTAYGMVQAVRDESETVESLTASALAYVTRDRRAYGGNGQAVWQTDARPESLPYAAYRPSSAFHPDLHTGSHVAPLQPVRGFRANTGSKGRKGPKAGQASEDTSHGASAARTCGTLTSATGGPNDAGLTAKRADRADTADLAAHEAQDSRAQGTACRSAHSHAAYAVRVFTGTASGLITEHEQGSPYAATCGCGPTTGQALILTGNGWTHALSVCPVPSQATLPDGTLSAIVRCGCGRKRGALTGKGEHQAR
jgi:hypothetical protein